MNTDSYNEIINGNLTYKQIAETLKFEGRCFIGWTDEEYTHFDILFTLNATKYGYTQRGINGKDLFVSIIDHTSYGFNTESIKQGGYIQEKLRLSDNLGEKVTELINGIISELNRGEENANR